jgi:hypothetical protein
MERRFIAHVVKLPAELEEPKLANIPHTEEAPPVLKQLVLHAHARGQRLKMEDGAPGARVLRYAVQELKLELVQIQRLPVVEQLVPVLLAKPAQ